MHLTHITCLLLFLLASHHARADDESSTETNEIIPREAIQKLDFSVRQALLRAIDKLEKEATEDENNENDDDPDSTTIAPTIISIHSTAAVPVTTSPKEEILEESTSPSDIFPSIQFFTATYDENNAQEQPLALFIDKTKKKNHKNLGSPTLVATSVNDDDKDNNQAARSVSNNVQANEISLNSVDEIKFEIRNSKTKTASTTEVYSTTTTTTTTTPRPKTTKKRTTTTSTTTTTTTPRPTHNEDGENIEVVAKDDIRILAAPLVSAFTVDLDESGSAKKVIPIIDSPATTKASIVSSTQRTSSIFQPPFGPTITKLNVLPAEAHRSSALNFANSLPPLSTQATIGTSTVNNIFSNIVPTSGHYITKQPLTANLNQQLPQQQGTNVNNYLIEKQRELEQQIYQLKFQAQQQQELILRQLKLLEEQTKLRGNNNNQPQQLPLIQQQQQQEPGFTIRPSIEFIPSTQSKTAPIYPALSLEQQLPLKESNGKYINGRQLQQQYNSNGGFPKNIVQTPQQHQQQPQDINPIQHVFQKLQNLQNLQNLHKSNTQAAASISSIQIQPSNQLNIVPTFTSLLPQTPAELSLVQTLPQRNYQQFQQQNPLVPQYVTDAVLERQQQQQQQQQNRARLFRQEGGTGNFGVNQGQTQTNNNNLFSSYNQQQQQQQQSSTNNFDNQNFYRQHLIPAFSNQLQQNAQTYYQQQQQQQQQQQTQQNSPAGNFQYNNQRLTLLPTNQASSAPTQTQSLAPSSARFSSNIF